MDYSKFYCTTMSTSYIADFVLSAILFGYDNSGAVCTDIFDYYCPKMLWNSGDLIK